jgi:hypothetical protein
VLLFGVPPVLFLRTLLLSGAVRGPLPIELPFVIIANVPSIRDVTRGRKIVSALCCVRYWSRRGFAELIALRCARARGPLSRVRSTKVMRGPLPPRRVDRACTLRISGVSPDLAVARDRRSLLFRTGVPSIRTRVWCHCGPQTDEHRDRLRMPPNTPVGLARSATSCSSSRATGQTVPCSVCAPAQGAWSSPGRPGRMVASRSSLPLSWRRSRAGIDGALATASRSWHCTGSSLRSRATRRADR